MLDLNEFFGKLRLEAGMQFYLPGSLQHSRTAGGLLSAAQLGAPLWRGSVTATMRGARAAAAVQAMISDLDQTGGLFMVRALPACGPASDPKGDVLGEHEPLLDTIDTDRRQIRISALPAQYELRGGDFLSIEDGGRYWLHQVVTDSVTASNGGRTPSFRVTPPIYPGVTANRPVTLIKPRMKAVIEPDSIQWPLYGPGTNRVSFDFIQAVNP